VKKNPERELMSAERRLDLAQNEIRKALGEVRKVLEYHKLSRQKSILGFLDREPWKKHQADYRPGPKSDEVKQ